MIKKEEESQPQLLNVQQAAKYLGVHVGTVRRWAYAKILKGTKIGIRGDWRFDESEIEKMAQSTDLVDDVNYSPLLPIYQHTLSEVTNKSHFVHFYEQESYILDSVSKYIETGDAAVIIATPEHREYLINAIPEQNQTQRKYIFLDAAETLSKFMVNGVPDLALFDSVMGTLIRDLAKDYKEIRAFGEMVALLWTNNNRQGAIRLEELWNNLQNNTSFALYCAYPMDDIGGSTASDSFSNVCSTHSTVIPTESFINLDTDTDRLREIALLQQKAQALEIEIELHKATENRLLQAVEALQQSDSFNNRVVEHSADCIKLLDPDGMLLTMNEPGCKLFEVDDFSIFVGKNYRELWQGEYFEQVSTAIEHAETKGIGRFQGFCPTAKGTPKWWDVVITPIYKNNNTLDRFLVISRDITLFKELEQRKDDFLSATSHELKTPLTSQKAFIQMLKVQIEKGTNKGNLKYINKINDQTDKLAKLVTDLLDVSKMQGGKLVLNLTTFNINDCVKEVVEEIVPIAKNHTIKINNGVKKMVHGDKEKISQVIINFLTNAIKYSPHANSIIINLKKEMNNIIVSVQDFGIGIDKIHKDKVFDRFYRVSDSDEKTYPGLGMGLFIASEIIKQHGGIMGIESEKGKGSIFSFSIPLS